MAKEGFELYTADQRYLSVVRGTFVFVSYAPDALQLASITFMIPDTKRGIVLSPRFYEYD